MIHGILNVYKEKGYTSHDAVAKLRGILHQKKIGHTGTLDPDAEGVLPVCLGAATKLCDMLTEEGKEYRAVLLLGTATDTQDAGGRVLSVCDRIPPEDRVLEAVRSFLGEYDQVPPMYSALKINGKKLYELAREGKTVERKARRVTIYGIEAEQVRLPRVTIRVSCSKGTYIRTLCSDIGEALGCGGCMESLVRTRAAGFSVEESQTLSQIAALAQAGRISECVLPVDAVFADRPALYTLAQTDRLLHNGNPLVDADLFGQQGQPKDGQARLYDSAGQFCGLYERTWDGVYRPVKMFPTWQEGL